MSSRASWMLSSKVKSVTPAWYRTNHFLYTDLGTDARNGMDDCSMASCAITSPNKIVLRVIVVLQPTQPQPLSQCKKLLHAPSPASTVNACESNPYIKEQAVPYKRQRTRGKPDTCPVLTFSTMYPACSKLQILYCAL
jgi:hypothetical protein